MSRKFFFNVALLCLTLMAGCLSLTACSDDDNEWEVADQLTTIQTKFFVTLSDDWYRYFDIQVKYVSEKGVQNATLTQNRSFDSTIPYSAEPATFIFSVTAQPKANAPVIDAHATFSLTADIGASVSGIRKDGTEDDRYGSQGKRLDRREVSAKEMEKYIQKAHSLFSFKYVPEKQ